ncbi:MAG: aminotransferase class I/II-fold pyridoxal phosphate-dependent enzyme [Bacteroidota bacterium]
MATSLNRREWLKNSSLAALTLGFTLPSMANEEGLLRNFGMAQGLINLGSNENPYGISPWAKDALLAMLGESNRYQFNVPSLVNFEKELASYFKVGANQVLATAGSGDALGKLARHFNKGNLVTATPTFASLPNTAKKIGTKVIEVPLTAEKIHDLPAMLKAMDSNTQMVYICNPANPSSTILSSKALKDFCVEAAKKAVVVIDEAYIDFLDAPNNESMIGLIEKNPNVIVVRTFSKIHAMAGLRVGFVVAHPTIIKALDDNYFANSKINISNTAIAAALASLKDEVHRTSCKQKNAAARNYTFNALKEMNIACIPSYTNFLFFPLGKYPGDFSQDMLKKNVILRSNTYPDGKWARVSVGTMDEMKQFIGLMKADWKS